MTDLRESHISIRMGTFDEGSAKSKLFFRFNFGQNEYENNLKKIKDLGVEPSENVVVMTHEFITEEAASSAVTKLSQLYEMMGSQMSMFSEIWETPKAIGKTIVVTLKVPEKFAQYLGIIAPFVDFLGDLLSFNQYIEFSILGKETLMTGFKADSGTPNFFYDSPFAFKLAICSHKEMPKKITEILSQMVSETAEKIKMVGNLLSSINHIHFDFEADEISAEAKGILNNEAISLVMAGAQMAYGMAQQFGLMDVAKVAGPKTVATFCLGPAISIEFVVEAATFAETLEKLTSTA